jgi:hypothetical protein
LAKETSEESSRKHRKELENYIKTIPPPTPEHTAELKMERKLKRIIEKEKKK